MNDGLPLRTPVATRPLAAGGLVFVAVWLGGDPAPSCSTSRALPAPSPYCTEHSCNLLKAFAEVHRILVDKGNLFVAVPLGWETNSEHPYFLVRPSGFLFWRMRGLRTPRRTVVRRARAIATRSALGPIGVSTFECQDLPRRCHRSSAVMIGRGLSWENGALPATPLSRISRLGHRHPACSVHLAWSLSTDVSGPYRI